MPQATTTRRRALTSAAGAALLTAAATGLIASPAQAATAPPQAAVAAATTSTGSWTASVTGVRHYVYNNVQQTGTATAPAGIPANATITGVSWTATTTINRTSPYGDISGTEIAAACAPTLGACSDQYGYASSGSTTDLNGMPASTPVSLNVAYYNPAHTNDGTRFDSIQYGFVSVNPVTITVTYSY